MEYYAGQYPMKINYTDLSFAPPIKEAQFKQSSVEKALERDKYYFGGERKLVPKESSVNKSIYSSSSLDENARNEYWKNKFHDLFKKVLLPSIRKHSIEPGILTEADKIIADAISENNLSAMNCLNDLVISCFADRDHEVLASLMLLISRIPSGKVGTIGEMMIHLCIGHKEIIVQEAAIRAIESWEMYGVFQYMDQMKWWDDRPQWLLSYVDDIRKFENAE